MNLLIEIGNTALKAAWSDGMTLGKTFRYQGEKMMDFVFTLFSQKERPDILVIASTFPIAPEDEERLQEQCRKLVLLDSNHLGLLQKTGLPKYLSYDRAASILAVRYLFRGKGCTIMDFGTTLTVDLLSADGQFLGGNISPGCRTRFKSLNRYSRRLPLVNTPEECPETGTSIPSSIEAGVISGILFEIQGYQNLHPDNIVVFTGGDANYFAKRMKSSIFVVCNLVLMGLALIADRYVEE